MNKTLIAGIVVLSIIIAGVLFARGKAEAPAPAGSGTSTGAQAAEEGGRERPVACTMEAKICPDGTAVGRTGPNCEFAPCPGE